MGELLSTLFQEHGRFSEAIRIHIRPSSFLAAALPMVAILPARSQHESTALEQVIVTAEKRKTSLEEIPG